MLYLRRNRILSFFLTFALLFSISTASITAKASQVNSSYTAESEINAQYTKHTIYFDDSQHIITASVNPAADEIESENVKNIKLAIEYVKSLNLSNMGYSYLENSCLIQLYRFLEEEQNGTADGGLFNSYTVLIPNSRASMPVFGTVDGRTFYSNIDSQYSKTYSANDLSDKKNLQAFVTGGVGVLLSLIEPTKIITAISIGVSVFSVIAGITPKYEVHDNAFIKSYFILDYTNRGIYTQNSNGKYGSDKTKLVEVLSDQSAKITPYAVFHTNDSSLADPAPTKTFNSSSTATTYYNDKNTTLGLASNRYHDTNKSPWAFTINISKVTAEWKK